MTTKKSRENWEKESQSTAETFSTFQKIQYLEKEVDYWKDMFSKAIAIVEKQRTKLDQDGRC
jgi:molecular chaperone GrpE (heat shock protein)